jgi:hypothetical protein
MLCKILEFHGDDYEECRFCNIETHLLPHRKHYICAAEPRWLMLCMISGFHGDDYEECRHLGCIAFSSCKNRRFGGTYRLRYQSDKNW